MKGKLKFIIPTIIFVIAIQIVVAQAMGISIIDLINQKANILAEASTTGVASALEQEKQDTISDASIYFDDYISEIQSALNEYAVSEEENAKQQLRAQIQETIDILEAQKEEAINNGKIKIKVKIDEELTKSITELESELSIKIKQKFGE